MSTAPTDPYEHDRRRMVDEQIRARGVKDERVLAAMERVPRERFLPVADAEAAYADKALPLSCGQTISQPYVVAAMTEALRLRPYHKVLEIGTGSGYQTAILALLAQAVYTIERINSLQQRAREVLDSLGLLNITFRTGDGTLGWVEASPFDRIIVTAAAPDVPGSLLAQLTPTGRLVVPVGPGDEQTLTVVERIGDTIRELPGFPCRFVKLIGQEGWEG